MITSKQQYDEYMARHAILHDYTLTQWCDVGKVWVRKMLIA